MHELYLTCPTTGETFYAGVQADAVERRPDPQFLAKCPVCSVKHEWPATGAWFEIAVTTKLPDAA